MGRINYEVAATVALGRRNLDLWLDFANKLTLSWNEVGRADTYTVYRGTVADLDDSDTDGLPDAGYGSCQADPEPADTSFTDATLPAVGEAFFYLVSYTAPGGETGFGKTWDCLARPLPGCDP